MTQNITTHDHPTINPQIPIGWDEVKLGDLGTLARGKSKHRPRDDQKLFGGAYPFIQTGEVKAVNKYITNFSNTYSDFGLKQSKLWSENTLCITIAANIAEIAILKIPACFPDSIIGFTADNNNTNIDFIFYLLKHFKSEIQSYGRGSVQDNINLGTFETHSFLVPTSTTEQQAIASILSSLDDKIELLRDQNKTLEDLGQKLFQRELAENGANWEERRLGELGQIICGKTPSTVNPQNFDGDVPFIKIPDMHGQMFVIQTNQTLSEIGANTQKNKFVPANSLCVSCIATVGVVSITTENSQTNQQINSIVPNNVNFLEWIYYSILDRKSDLMTLGAGGAVTLNVNTGLFSNFEILIPNEESLAGFHDTVSPIFSKILANTQQIQTLSQTRDTLLPRLMSGEVRVGVECNI